MTASPSDLRCSRCGSVLAQDAPSGLCPRCLLTTATRGTEAGERGALEGAPAIPDLAAAFPELEVLGFIGAGGMSFVYRVRERDSGRIAALKILPRSLAGDPSFLGRFEREARTLERLNHPHIVALYRFGRAGDYCHLLMEYVEGANLRQAMRTGRFTPGQALALIPPLCEALQYAHAQGVLHRDIKPENILLDTEGRVKIADFGIAKILSEGEGRGDQFPLTQTGARLGTPHYMAPEQVERPEAVDHRADIYSLGVVFYELLTGELPLGRFPAPSEKSALDARVDQIVFRALAKEREMRQQSAGEVKKEVEGLAAAGGTAGGIRARGGSRWPMVLALVVAMLALLAAAPIPGWNRLLAPAVPFLLFLMVVVLGFSLATRGLGRTSYGLRGLALAAAALLAAWSYWKWPVVRGPVPQPSLPGMAIAAQLGQQLADSREGPFFEFPGELLIDPRTQQPFEFWVAGATNLMPGAMIASTPFHEDGRLILLNDGSVHPVTEAEFRLRMGTAEPHRDFLLGPEIAEAEAERWMTGGAGGGITLTKLPGEGLRRSRVALADAMDVLEAGQSTSATLAIAALLRSGTFHPDREYFFSVQAKRRMGAARDIYHSMQARQGGLLAMLVLLAARDGNAAQLSWALEQGRALWAGKDRLLLCLRGLEGTIDQTWEGVWVDASQLQALKPGGSMPVTVVRHFKAFGNPSITNQVDFPWPREP